MSNPIPPFLSHWNATFHSLHLPAPAPDPTPLLTHYAEPHRHYHNAHHILDCLIQLDAFFAAPSDPFQSKIQNVAGKKSKIALALFYHDAIYDPRASDNESQSAQLAQHDLSSLLPSGFLADLTRLIQITDHKSAPSSEEEQLLLDLDLSILGSPPPKFAAYESAIRKEYSHVPDQTFRQARGKILQYFLARPHIYHTAFFHQSLESQSRLNLQHSISQLTSPSKIK